MNARGMPLSHIRLGAIRGRGGAPILGGGGTFILPGGYPSLQKGPEAGVPSKKGQGTTGWGIPSKGHGTRGWGTLLSPERIRGLCTPLPRELTD